MGRYSKAFSIKKQFQSPNCQTCQGQSRTLKKIVFLELLLRIIEEEKWNLFEKLGQLRTPNMHIPPAAHYMSSPLHELPIHYWWSTLHCIGEHEISLHFWLWLILRFPWPLQDLYRLIYLDWPNVHISVVQRVRVIPVSRGIHRHERAASRLPLQHLLLLTRQLQGGPSLEL